MPDTLMAPRSTGRAVGSVRASLLVVSGLWTLYRRSWRATAFSSVGTPVLYLLAMGLGFGSQVRASVVPGGLSYLVYLTPALLPVGALATAAGECSYPILGGFQGSKNFFSVTTTPITPNELVTGQTIWIAMRLGFSGAGFLVVATLIGAVTGPGILLSLVFAVFTGLAFGLPLMALSAHIKGDGRAFAIVFRFVVVPMTLFAGAFFPISQLPAWIRPVAWVTPLWHGTELARGAALGGLAIGSAVLHVAVLLAYATTGLLLSRWRFRRRLAR